MKKEFRILVGMMVAVILATLILTGCSAEQNNLAPVPAQAANPISATAPVSSSNGAPQEGIKVHGYWTIDVTNPDGTTAGHYEFENALVSSGTYSLSLLLSRQSTMGGWEIVLSAGPAGSITLTGNDAFTNSDGQPFPAHIGEANYPTAGEPNNFNNLTLSLPPDPATWKVNYLKLGGYAVATRDGVINSVQTGFSAPPVSYNVPLGGYNGMYPFTERNLDNQISLTAGQQVTVTVVISFS